MSARQKTTAKILALIPVVGLAAACNGLAPTAPSEPVGYNGSNESAASGGVAAATTSPGPCKGIHKVELQVDDSSRTVLWVQATYRYSGAVVARCAAPTWSSNRDDMVQDRQQPFRAGFLRSAIGQAVLTATAPNGVQNSVRLDLGPNSLRRGDNDNCDTIVGVDLRILPSGDDTTVWIQATYVFPGDTPDNCRAPPSFSASRRGLRIHPNDKFRAGIDRSLRYQTTVQAAAPNDVAGKITF
jgi:hypothetical protein